MNRKALFTLMLALILTLVLVVPASAEPGIWPDLAKVRRATAAYHDIPTAKAAGYNLLSFYSFCVKNPELGAMGFHYIKMALVDDVVEPLQPEAMVYTRGDSGELELTSVEYIVAAGLWNALHSQPPSLFGQTFGYNPGMNVYSMHAWIWRPNPAGMFAYYNPKLSCD